jgi:protein-S-isoprenylcysteine O-methyltransferase Ste14
MKDQPRDVAIPRHLHSEWMVACGNFLFHYRNGLFPAIFLILALLVRPGQFLGNEALDCVMMAAGAAIVLTGQFFRVFVIGYAYIRRGGKKRRIHADDLVVAGLYAHCRNPMYVGNFLIACGFCLFYGSALLCALMIPFFGWVYLAITAAEERYLLAKFGAAYGEYMKKVNRFVPDFRGMSRTLSGHSFRWREVLSKEYGTLTATVTGLTIIAMWKGIHVHGWETKKTEVIQLAWLFGPLILFYVTVRFMKLTGRLSQAKTKPGIRDDHGTNREAGVR